MLSKNNIKHIRSLDQKKFRKEHNIFVVEGEKMVVELLNSNIKINHVYALPEFISRHQFILNDHPLTEINSKELKQISQLVTPNFALALAEIPNQVDSPKITDGLIIALDKIQDPGNMGTIIRTANWFGIKSIICSNDCVDTYNPKVIQSTMGAIFGTQIAYCDLEDVFMRAQKNKIPIYGTVLDGENIYKKELHQNAIIAMGNESKGLSENLKKYVDQKILIPTYPIDSIDHVESLNVGVAASIVLAEFRRRG